MRLFSACRALFAAESGFLLTATTKTTGLLDGIARGRTEEPENNAGPENLLEKLSEGNALVDFEQVGNRCCRLNIGSEAKQEEEQRAIFYVLLIQFPLCGVSC